LIEVHALWTRLRRLGASMMLVAALAFAFHSGVVAASDVAGSSRASASSVQSHQSQGPHDHVLGEHGSAAEGGAHVHADAGHSGHHDGKGHCKANCCGAACTIAVLSTPAFQVSRVEVSSVLTGLFAPALSGIDPSGLKRPPRTPSIA
jgi:hypothetical protein